MNLHHQQTIRLTDHPVAATERPLGPPPEPYPGIARKAQGHKGMLRTCEIYWRIRQDNQDRSTDRVGALRYVMTAVAPDTVCPAGSNKTDKVLLSSIVISPSTEAPHTHNASQMK